MAYSFKRTLNAGSLKRLVVETLYTKNRVNPQSISSWGFSQPQPQCSANHM